MRAIVLTEHGGPEVLRIQEVPTPQPGPDEVAVDVWAAGVNRADLLQREGRYPPPGPQPTHEIPGLEMAGAVVGVGTRVRRFRVGNRVAGLLPGGGYAQRVISHQDLLFAVPPDLGWTQAAAIPEVFLTAYDALIRQAGMGAGDRILVHAAASGVGTAAVQLGRWAGAYVFGTAGSAAKCQAAEDLGARIVLEMADRGRDFATILRESSGGDGFDVVLDLVGGSYFERNLAALAPRGRLITLGLVGGARAEIDLGQLLSKRLTLIGSNLRNRSLGERAGLTAAFTSQVLPALAAGLLRPIVGAVLPWTEAAEAHRILQADAVIGKVILRIT